MAQFKTSFIPRNTISSEKGKVSNTIPKPNLKTKNGSPIDLFLIIGTILFIASILTAGGLFVYKYKIANDIKDDSKALETARESVDPSTIAQLENLDKHFSEAKDILSTHKALTPFLNAVEVATLHSVRFKSFSYSEDKGVYQVRFTGEASNYESLALQSTVFSKAGIMENPVFSNLKTDVDTGNVQFQLVANVVPSIFDYQPAPPVATAQ